MLSDIVRNSGEWHITDIIRKSGEREIKKKKKNKKIREQNVFGNITKSA